MSKRKPEDIDDIEKIVKEYKSPTESGPEATNPFLVLVLSVLITAGACGIGWIVIQYFLSLD